VDGVPAVLKWELWSVALLVSSLLYAILKIKVPVSEASRQKALIGVALAESRGDVDFARIGLQMAASEWKRRKRFLLVISGVVGLLATGVVAALWPTLLTWPMWLYALAAVIAVFVFFKSKY